MDPRNRIFQVEQQAKRVQELAKSTWTELKFLAEKKIVGNVRNVFGISDAVGICKQTQCVTHCRTGKSHAPYELLWSCRGAAVELLWTAPEERQCASSCAFRFELLAREKIIWPCSEESVLNSKTRCVCTFRSHGRPGLCRLIDFRSGSHTCYRGTDRQGGFRTHAELLHGALI